MNRATFLSKGRYCKNWISINKSRENIYFHFLATFNSCFEDLQSANRIRMIRALFFKFRRQMNFFRRLSQPSIWKLCWIMVGNLEALHILICLSMVLNIWICQSGKFIVNFAYLNQLNTDATKFVNLCYIMLEVRTQSYFPLIFKIIAEFFIMN